MMFSGFASVEVIRTITYTPTQEMETCFRVVFGDAFQKRPGPSLPLAGGVISRPKPRVHGAVSRDPRS